MKPIRYTIRIYQGASWRLDATFRDEQGEILDLSSYEAQLMVRRNHLDDTPLMSIGSETGEIIMAGATSPNMTIRFPRSQTEDLPTYNQEVLDWIYDLKVWHSADPEFTTIRLLEGDVIVSPAVTRPLT